MQISLPRCFRAILLSLVLVPVAPSSAAVEICDFEETSELQLGVEPRFAGGGTELGTGAAGAAGVGGTVASFEAGPSHAFPRFAGGHLEYPKLRGRDDADADDDVNHFLSSVNPANPANPAPASPAPVSQPSLPRDFFPPARSPRSPVPPLSWENKIRRDVQTDLQKAVNQVSEPRFSGGSPRLDELPVPRLPKRETFANGAARFAGGGASGREDLHEDPRREISLPRSMDETSLPGDARDAVTYEFRKTFGDIKTRESPPRNASTASATAATSAATLERLFRTNDNSESDGSYDHIASQDVSTESYSVDCGTTIIQPKKWHFTFRPPNLGDFNIPITVHRSPDQKSYQIANMEVSVSAELDNWQPFALRLIAPTRTSILLKEGGTSECADLRCDFTEIASCHSCTRPKETLSAFTGESALGTWMVAFEDSEGRKRTGAMAWAALKITWSCDQPLEQS